MRDGALLSEDGIRRHIADLVKHLRASRLDQAGIILELLALERLLMPAARNTALAFGYERVCDTATHLSACESAVKGSDEAGALSEAEQALTRWTGE